MAVKKFDYEIAFNRTLGGITAIEQQRLRGSKVAVAGMGGVGGAHLLTLVRLGIGAFSIADMDTFGLENFNRQVGANLHSVGKAKVDVMRDMALAINPELAIDCYPQGVDSENIDAFLASVNVVVDGLDFFAIKARRMLFARARAAGLWAITAGPIGMGTAYILFDPEGMTFDRYFDLHDGLDENEQHLRFLLGLAPKQLHMPSVADARRIDLARRRGPSSPMGVNLAAGVVGAEVVKVITKRGKQWAAPFYHQFDAFSCNHVRGRRRMQPWRPLHYAMARAAFTRISQDARPPELELHPTPIERTLERARWAPSEYNSQPWRFTIRNELSAVIKVIDGRHDDVYDARGSRSLLSVGCLIEAASLAAATEGYVVEAKYSAQVPPEHEIGLTLIPSADVEASELAHFLHVRSVNRSWHRTTSVPMHLRRALETTIGDALELRWHSTLVEKSAQIQLNAQATALQMQLPELYQTHARVFDFKKRFSESGIPSAALGPGPFARVGLRFALRSPRAYKLMMSTLQGHMLAPLETDVAPGFMTGAHFTLVWRPNRRPSHEPSAMIEAGRAVLRFWLRATQLGLALQPCHGPISFALHAADGSQQRSSNAALGRMKRIHDSMVGGLGCGVADVAFRGRLGFPRGATENSRSVRRSLRDLIASTP